MAQLLIQHIFVDSNGAKKVTNEFSGGAVANIQLQPGDTVKFKSNRPDTEIRYHEFNGPQPPNTQLGSPFAPVLPAGKRYKVSVGTEFTVTKACDFDSHFIFDCGRDLNGFFSEWSTLAGDQPGGATPGPED